MWEVNRRGDSLVEDRGESNIPSSNEGEVFRPQWRMVVGEADSRSASLIATADNTVFPRRFLRRRTSKKSLGRQKQDYIDVVQEVRK
jgi:hypothetical protein